MNTGYKKRGSMADPGAFGAKTSSDTNREAAGAPAPFEPQALSFPRITHHASRFTNCVISLVVGGAENRIADGVALAAIQGLNEKVEGRMQNAEVRSRRLEEKLERKETEITELKAHLDRLEQLLNP